MADRRRQVFHAVAKHLSCTKAAETLLDDAALIQFRFRFLRQVLFGEMSFRVLDAGCGRRHCLLGRAAA
jgi:hypothetical protein